MGIIPGDPIWPGGIFAGLDTLALALLVVCIVALVGLVLLYRTGPPDGAIRRPGPPASRRISKSDQAS